MEVGGEGEEGEPKQYRTEVLPLTSLTPYRWAKPAHRSVYVRFHLYGNWNNNNWASRKQLRTVLIFGVRKRHPTVTAQKGRFFSPDENRIHDVVGHRGCWVRFLAILVTGTATSLYQCFCCCWFCFVFCCCCCCLGGGGGGTFFVCLFFPLFFSFFFFFFFFFDVTTVSSAFEFYL